MVKAVKKTDNLKEKKRQESKSAIIKAAKAVFLQGGYAGASMSQIAKKARVAQGLIYYYFENKESLWKAVKQDALNQFGMSSDFGGASAASFQEFLTTVLANRLSFYRRNPEIWTIVAWENLQSPGVMLFGVTASFRGLWYDELMNLQMSGKINKSIDATLLSTLITSAFVGVLDDIPRIYEPDDVARKQEEYLAMVVSSLCGSFIGSPES